MWMIERVGQKGCNETFGKFPSLWSSLRTICTLAPGRTLLRCLPSCTMVLFTRSGISQLVDLEIEFVAGNVEMFRIELF